MTFSPPVFAAVVGLFAAGFDWLEALLPFLFVGFWIVSQVIAAIKRLGNGLRPDRPLPRFDPDRVPRPAPQMDGGDAADARAELDRQIAEFLRDMTERKQRPSRPAATGERATGPAAARPRPQPQAGGSKPPAVRGAAASIPAAGRRPAAQEPAAQKRAVAPKTGSVAAAEPVESVAAHVSEVFGKEMAHLRGDIAGDFAATRRAAVPVSSAQQLVTLLRDPQTVRQLVLLREVFERPVERW